MTSNSAASKQPLRFLVFGATGRTGIVLVQQALHRGHRVTAFVRNPQKFPEELHGQSGLEIVKGDIADQAAVERAIAAQKPHVIYSALNSEMAPHNSVSTCAKSTIEALQRLPSSGNGSSSSFPDASKVRYISVGGMGLAETKNNFGTWTSIAYKTLTTGYNWYFGGAAVDQEIATKLQQQSNQPFTILCPFILTNGPLTGKYESGDALKDSTLFNTISRQDLAHLALDLGEEHAARVSAGEKQETREPIPNFVYVRY